MSKPRRRPLKPFKAAIWDEAENRWCGTPPRKKISIKAMELRARKMHADFIDRRQQQRATRKKIRLKSAKQKEEDRIYAALKPVWRANPKNHYCQALCRDAGVRTSAEPYPHHIRGRGALLNDVRFWLPICPSCHHWIENNRAEARRRGWLASRDQKTMQVEGIKLCRT